jgi:hypothetical protein
MSTHPDRDDFENAYLSAVRALRVLAASPEEACEMQGHYNVAFETKMEVEAAPYVFKLPGCTLTQEQHHALLDVISALQAIPKEVLSFANVREESLERMRHPSWEAPRQMARALIEDLKPATDLNAWYFEQDRSEW